MPNRTGGTWEIFTHEFSLTQLCSGIIKLALLFFYTSIMDLKTALNKRLEDMGMTKYELAVKYGRLKNPSPGSLDSEVANKHSATIRKVLSAPETCKPSTLKDVLEILHGKLTIQVEFTEIKTYNLNL